VKNLGIIIAFGVGFTFLMLIFAEYNTSTAVNTSVTLFKRGTKRTKKVSSPSSAGAGDVERGASGSAADLISDPKPNASNEKTAPQPPANPDVFTWRNVRYSVPIKGEDIRFLLSDISGYVAPGKSTALMGESGAGRTTFLNLLAKRVYSGVVTGDMLVNG
jgi:ATP-binding cassette subfamily G (WHITE) protein 2 (SNQ2)